MSFFSWNCIKDASNFTEATNPYKNTKVVSEKLDSDIAEKLRKAPSWQEIEGYKALDSAMKSFYGDMQYELNHTYKLSGKIAPCEKGYHFYRNKRDLFSAYPPANGIRYFKVKALVPVYASANKEEVFITPKSCARLMYEEEWQRYHENRTRNKDDLFCDYHYPSLKDFSAFDSKYVASEITLIEEIPFLEYMDKVNPFFVRNEEDYKALLTNGDYKAKALTKWLERVEGIFSTTFSTYLFTRALNLLPERARIKITSYQEVYEKLDRLISAIEEEPISQDFKVMFMLDGLND